jgi:hypothetical protein
MTGHRDALPASQIHAGQASSSRYFFRGFCEE